MSAIWAFVKSMLGLDCVVPALISYILGIITALILLQQPNIYIYSQKVFEVLSK